MTTAWAGRDHIATKPIRLVGKNHPALHQAAAPVVEFDEDLMILAHRMRLACMQRRGVAIAAPQVGVAIQLVVVLEDGDAVPIVNPKIETGGKLVAGEESCLSIPGRRFEVPRYDRVVVDGQALDGVKIGCAARDLSARMWQHEKDHLDGLLLTGRFDEIRGR